MFTNYVILYCRWKRTSSGIVMDSKKPVLEFVAVQRKDNLQWAIPGVNENLFLTVNDRLSAAALIKVFRFLGAALIRLRRLFDCGAYFKD